MLVEQLSQDEFNASWVGRSTRSKWDEVLNVLDVLAADLDKSTDNRTNPPVLIEYVTENELKPLRVTVQNRYKHLNGVISLSAIAGHRRDETGQLVKRRALFLVRKLA